MLNIYFAGSMQGGCEDTPLYARIVEHLKKYGKVLSEWVAYRMYDDISDQEAHRIATDGLSKADVLVAEVTIPSLGVGYEIGRMSVTSKPILCLFRPHVGKKISAMIQGADNGSTFRVVYYEEENFAEMSFKIYFAGSMRAGRDDAPLYKLIVEHLKKHGTVLSEWTAYDRNEDGMDDKEIYERDMAALSTADVLVAEVSMPSLGVGYEIARASLANKPVLCLFRPSSGRKLSAMIQGAENEKSFRVVHYKDNEYVATIDDFFNSLKS